MVLVMMMLDYKKKISFFLLFLFFSSGNSASGNWSYFGPGGSKNWKLSSPLCDGKQQSPVDIITALTFPREFGPIKRVNYKEAAAKITVTNNGKTVAVTLDGKPRATISGGGLKTEYIAHHFHFHWGQTDDYGSEHYKDGVAFPIEMHIVHYSSKYKDLKSAMDRPEGLAVLGFFFSIDEKNNPTLQTIINQFPSIQKVGKSVKSTLLIDSLLPEDTNKFYRYAGSLTTPKCFETVVWTVFESTIPVSSLQVKEFRTMLDVIFLGPAVKIFDNFRELQPLYQREIYVSSADHIQALIVTLIIGVHFL